MKRIVVQSHTSRLGGAELCLIDLCETILHNYDAKITVILPDEGDLEKRLNHLPNVQTVIIHSRWWVSPNDRWERRVIRSLINYQAQRKTSKLLEKLQPDLTITNTICTPVLAKASHYLSVPHLWFVHEMTGGSLGLQFEDGQREALHQMFTLSKKVIFNSETVRNYYLDAKDDRRTNSEILYPLVDNHDITFKLIPNVRHQRSEMKILNVGAIQPGKQQHLLIEIAHLLHQRQIPFEVDFVGANGDPEYKTKLDEMVESYNLKGIVNFVGFHDNIHKMMNEADVLVHCGVEEGFGRVIAEAFSAKLPVLMFHSGSAEELIGNNERGYLFSSSEEAAHIIEDIFGDPEKLVDTTESAFFFAQKFGTLLYEKKVVTIMRDFLGPPNLEV